MGEMSELFHGTYHTLRSVKRAIDEELDAGSGAVAPDDATLERLLSLSRLHAAMARKLQDMMLDQGSGGDLEARVQHLRESYENTHSEIALRLWTRRGSPMPEAADRSDGRDIGQTSSQPSLEERDRHEEELLREAFGHTRRLFELQVLGRRDAQGLGQGTPTRRLRRDEEQRLRPDVAVRVFHRDRGYRAQLLDVGSAGARLGQGLRLPPDARVTLRYLHLSIRARVERSDDVLTTLQFRAPLTPDEVHLLRGAAGGRLESADAGLPPGA